MAAKPRDPYTRPLYELLLSRFGVTEVVQICVIGHRRGLTDADLFFMFLAVM